MALIAGLALLFAGGLCLLCAAILAAVRKQATGLLKRVPIEMHEIAAESVPEVARGLALLKLLPRLIMLSFGVGAALSVLGWAFLPGWWLKILFAAGGVGLAFGARPIMQRITPLIQRRLRNQLDTNASSHI